MKISAFLSAALIVLIVAAIPSARATDSIFWEAESTDDTNMTPNGPLKPVNHEETAELSDHHWLNGKVTEIPAYAHYTVQVSTAGTYRFYARKFWQHGAFHWRVDGGDWTEVRGKLKLLDTVVMRQYAPLNWTQLGEFALTAGPHKIDIEVINDATFEYNKYYGFDCFLLTTGEWEEYMQANPNLTSPR